jgi:hypothetical protein
MTEETDEETMSQVTKIKTPVYPSGPNLNNPLLPIHLNRDLTSYLSPLKKKFELPPATTIAILDQDQMINEAPQLAQVGENSIKYIPKWTKGNRSMSNVRNLTALSSSNKPSSGVD